MSSASAKPLVALLCLDTWVDDDANIGTFRPFNYAIRRIQAALEVTPDGPIARTVVLEGRSPDVDAIVARVQEVDPDIVAASAYVWSFPTFVRVAERLKAWRPDLTIIFGGPAARPSMFGLRPYRGKERFIDALALGEGEPVMRQLVGLPDRTRESLLTINGLALPTPDGFIKSAPQVKGRTLDEYPSPYQHGFSPPSVTAHLETFRGCPLSCAFCQWGVADQKSRALSTNFITEELLAFERLKSRGVYLVSAALNLNPVAFRNLVEAESRVGVLKRLSLHAELYPSLIRDEHLDFLESVRADNIGMGIQSIDEEVLRLQNRQPFDLERYKRVVPRVAKFPRAVLEIILGMPGDSPENFWRTIRWCMELPVRIHISKCLVLPDAYLDRPLPNGMTMEFDHDTLQMISCTGWTKEGLQGVDDELSRLYTRYDDGGAPWWQIGPPGRRNESLGRDPGYVVPEGFTY